MRFYRDLSHTRLSESSVVTIGNYDGVHLGHQALLKQCQELGSSTNDSAHEIVVVTFEPTPRAWFDPGNAPARISGTRDKLKLLGNAGVDLVWMMRFNGRLADMSAHEFVEKILVEGLRARHLVLGEDFRFGNQRQGSLELLQELGPEYGFTAEAVPAVMSQGERVSSTAVRARLSKGELREAEDLLGRPFTMSGRVTRGQQLGRKLGYPTANVRPPSGNSPVAGIFAVRSRIGDGPWRDGVANVGHRPVVNGSELLLEVHLFDFEGDIYGQRLETKFVRKIRDEQDFPGLDELVVQMTRDEQEARAALAAA